MSEFVVTAIIQGGAIVLLAFVLWQVSEKIGTAMNNMQQVLFRLMDIVADTKREASEAKQQAERNHRAIVGRDEPH